MQAEDAAQAYDRVAIAMGRPLTELNLHHSNYSDEMKTLQELGKSEVIGSYKREKSSEYRGVSKPKQRNHFQCYIRDNDEKKLHIGVFDKVNKIVICSFCVHGNVLTTDLHI